MDKDKKYNFQEPDSDNPNELNSYDDISKAVVGNLIQNKMNKKDTSEQYTGDAAESSSKQNGAMATPNENASLSDSQAIPPYIENAEEQRQILMEYTSKIPVFKNSYLDEHDEPNADDRKPIRDVIDDDIDDDIVKIVRHKPSSNPNKLTGEEKRMKIEAQKNARKLRELREEEAVKVSSERRKVVRTDEEIQRRKTYKRPENDERAKIDERPRVAEERPRKPLPSDERPKRRKKDYSREDLNFDKIEKQKNLDTLFNGVEEEENESKLNYKNIAIAAIVICIAISAVLGGRTASLSSQLKKVNDSSQELELVKSQNNELKLEILTLTEQLNTYKTGEAGTQGGEPQGGEGELNEGQEGSGGSENNSGSSIQASSGSSDPLTADTYTVVQGDTLSGISMKVYGNYSGYKRILEENGLSENSNLQVGQTLKIPR